jgi:hypothetical protein
VGSYLFTLPLFIWVLVSLIPVQPVLKVIPAFAATILLAPVVVLTFLGTGLEVLGLVTVLTVSLIELWVTPMAT